MSDPSDLSDLLRRAEPPTAAFTVADVLDRAATHRRRVRVTGATIIALLCIAVVGVVLAARPEPTVQVITPLPPPSVPVTVGPAEPTADGRLPGEFLRALRDLQEEPMPGVHAGWSVRDGDPVWWLTRGVNPDGTWCLVRGTAEGTEIVSARDDCGVVPFAITDGVAADEVVGVVVPDGYEQAMHGGATVAVEHNVAILPADGSAQPVVRVTGPAGTLDLTANTSGPPHVGPARFTFFGGRAAGEADITAVMDEVTEPGAPAPVVARATDMTTATTVALQFPPPGGSACVGLITADRADGSCIIPRHDARQIGAGPLWAAVAVDGVRAYLVADGWEALRLPNGDEAAVSANTITIPPSSRAAASGLLRHVDGREIVVGLRQR